MSTITKAARRRASNLSCFFTNLWMLYIGRKVPEGERRRLEQDFSHLQDYNRQFSSYVFVLHLLSTSSFILSFLGLLRFTNSSGGRSSSETSISSLSGSRVEQWLYGDSPVPSISPGRMDGDEATPNLPNRGEESQAPGNLTAVAELLEIESILSFWVPLKVVEFQDIVMMEEEKEIGDKRVTKVEVCPEDGEKRERREVGKEEKEAGNCSQKDKGEI
ncbi:hypothetical protein FEM48_Zijuj10G0016800 [Ziziphus jujuba var. spinosa]|uniref:Uncharacterized protein n=1 Tax=Ziziphus jujuba var. spinosa TaxID=714518 RepID=A0A978UKJ4_ZIZJJ|nr:hypothetical protein FEM48_Zijuj10G0016800 [Ziziphus jujuba var. spinosa]